MTLLARQPSPAGSPGNGASAHAPARTPRFAGGDRSPRRGAGHAGG